MRKKQHLSVWKYTLIYVFGVLLFIFGLLSFFVNIGLGIFLLVIGFSVIKINKFVYKLRRKQLEIDRDESLRDIKEKDN